MTHSDSAMMWQTAYSYRAGSLSSTGLSDSTFSNVIDAQKLVTEGLIFPYWKIIILEHIMCVCLG